MNPSLLIARYPAVFTVVLLTCSNLFMTIAWYGHLKNTKSPLIVAIVVSWSIAFLEYCFQVPANRIGYGALTLTQLKILQEVITLTVFTVYAFVVFGQTPKWNYGVSFLFMVGAVYFAFRFSD
ncbi:MAG: DMT family protein [Candidatus Eremiobacteraeota bacterium]|nr:DMT family protein [Candidatus Eremiobacteraeota bacterium]